MKKPPSLAARLDELSRIYKQQFAGERHATRDLALMDRLLADARAAATNLERRLGALRPDEKKMLARATGLRDLFARERAMIAAAKAKPPVSPEKLLITEPAGRAATYGNLMALTMQRHPSRADLATLSEVVEGVLRAERDALERTPEKRREPWMVTNLNVLATQASALRDELARIENGWSLGDVADRRDLLHALAEDVQAIAADEETFVPEDRRRVTRYRHQATAARTLIDAMRALGELTGEDADIIAPLHDFAARADAASIKRTAALAAISGAELARALATELEAIDAVYRRDCQGKRADPQYPSRMTALAIRAAGVYLEAADLWNRSPEPSFDELRLHAGMKSQGFAELIVQKPA